MDSSQSSSDTQRGMDPVERRMSPCNRAPASEELGGPTPPTGYGRVARRRAPAPSSGAPAAPGTPRALHFAKWALAMLGVFALYLLSQIVVSLIGGTVIAFIRLAVDGAGAEVSDALFDNGTQMVMAAAQLIAVAVFWPWWRRIRPGSFAERREAPAPAGAPVMKTIVSLLLVGFAAQFFVSGILGFVEMLFPETMAEYAELMEESAVGVFAIIQVISTVFLAPLNEEIVCRGVMLEYAMRAVSPDWDPRHRARRRAVSARVLDRQRVAGARVRRPPYEHHPGELCLRLGHPAGLGLLAHGQTRVRHAAALRPQRLVLSRRAAGAHGQRAAHAHRVRSLWGLARRGHRHVRARLARLGRPA